MANNFNDKYAQQISIFNSEYFLLKIFLKNINKTALTQNIKNLNQGIFYI